MIRLFLIIFIVFTSTLCHSAPFMIQKINGRPMPLLYAGKMNGGSFPKSLMRTAWYPTQYFIVKHQTADAVILKTEYLAGKAMEILLKSSTGEQVKFVPVWLHEKTGDLVQPYISSTPDINSLKNKMLDSKTSKIIMKFYIYSVYLKLWDTHLENFIISSKDQCYGGVKYPKNEIIPVDFGWNLFMLIETGNDQAFLDQMQIFGNHLGITCKDICPNVFVRKRLLKKDQGLLEEMKAAVRDIQKFDADAFCNDFLIKASLSKGEIMCQELKKRKKLFTSEWLQQVFDSI